MGFPVVIPNDPKLFPKRRPQAAAARWLYFQGSVYPTAQKRRR